jgi:hypothetical protein
METKAKNHYMDYSQHGTTNPSVLCVFVDVCVCRCGKRGAMRKNSGVSVELNLKYFHWSCKYGTQNLCNVNIVSDRPTGVNLVTSLSHDVVQVTSGGAELQLTFRQLVTSHRFFPGARGHYMLLVLICCDAHTSAGWPTEFLRHGLRWEITS